ncbi:MAG: MmgE/PrpD family protein, partial [Deltaproteobacteria bacterium]|nr:MmgE/PrpD family protein [Deltaproteobacteria bacterium]
MDIVFDLSRCIVGTSFEDLSPNTVDVTKRFILDTLGVGIAGSTAAGAKEAAEQMVEWGGMPESTIMCFGKKVPSLNAAFANSVMIHARDFDDAHDGAVV